jgi:hypothetical protein
MVLDKYNSLAICRKTKDGKYFFTTNPGAPFSISFIIKQAMDMNKKNREMYIISYRDFKIIQPFPETAVDF